MVQLERETATRAPSPVGTQSPLPFPLPNSRGAGELPFLNLQSRPSAFDYPTNASRGHTRLEMFSESKRAPVSSSGEHELGATDPRNCSTRNVNTERSNFSACRRSVY